MQLYLIVNNYQVKKVFVIFIFQQMNLYDINIYLNALLQINLALSLQAHQGVVEAAL